MVSSKDAFKALETLVLPPPPLDCFSDWIRSPPSLLPSEGETFPPTLLTGEDGPRGHRLLPDGGGDGDGDLGFLLRLFDDWGEICFFCGEFFGLAR